MRYLLPALAAFFCTGSVFALGLGEVEGRAIIGRPLQVSIPILGLQGDPRQSACTSLLPEGDDDGQGSIRLKVEGDRVHLSTARALNQPVLQFRIRMGCSGSIERSFVILPDAAQSAAPVPVLPVRAETPATAGGDAASAAPQTAAQVVTDGAAQRSIVLMSSTSLRMLSRQRYPGDSDVRVNFIRRVAAANPDLFASEDAAFDQRLAAGTRLLLPSGLPAPQRAESTATSSGGGSRSGAMRREVTAAPSGSAKPKREPARGRDRLLVGAAGLSAVKGPSTAELNESIDRLIEVMNQQIMVQMAMTERIKVVEAELAELKRQAVAEKHRAAQLEAELKAVRESVERKDTIQLVLLILLAGMAGAWALNWMSRRKAGAAAFSVYGGSADTSPWFSSRRENSFGVSPAPTPAVKSQVQTMPSAFDAAEDRREDIFPPGTLR